MRRFVRGERMTKSFVTALLALIALALSLDLSAASAATEPVEACAPIGQAEGETLYFCESDYGLDCVWDPSPVLGAGVMDCD